MRPHTAWPNWDPPYIRRRPPNLGNAATFRMRVASGLHPTERLRLHVEVEGLLFQLWKLDQQMVEQAEHRLAILDELGALRDSLYPVVDWCRGRRPPPVGADPLPPAAPGAVPLAGPLLRQACLQILDRHGELPLTQVHAWLHRYGYVVAGPKPVQVLADALGYEHDCLRAHRVRRGVYRLGPLAEQDGPIRGPLDPTPDGDPVTIVDPLVDAPMRHGDPTRLDDDGAPAPAPEPTNPWSDDDGEGIGLDGDGEAPGGADEDPVEPDRGRPIEVDGPRGDPPLLDRRVGHMCARGQPPPRLPAVTERERCRHRHHVEPAVTGVGAGRHVPGPDVLGVHHRHHRPPPPRPAPPRPAGDAVGHEPLRRAVVEHGHADVDGDDHPVGPQPGLGPAPPPEGPGQVTPEQPHDRVGRALTQQRRSGDIAVDHDQVVGHRRRATPVDTLLHRHDLHHHDRQPGPA